MDGDAGRPPTGMTSETRAEPGADAPGATRLQAIIDAVIENSLLSSQDGWTAFADVLTLSPGDPSSC